MYVWKSGKQIIILKNCITSESWSASNNLKFVLIVWGPVDKDKIVSRLLTIQFSK